MTMVQIMEIFMKYDYLINKKINIGRIIEKRTMGGDVQFLILRKNLKVKWISINDLFVLDDEIYYTGEAIL